MLGQAIVGPWEIISTGIASFHKIIVTHGELEMPRDPLILLTRIILNPNMDK